MNSLDRRIVRSRNKREGCYYDRPIWWKYKNGPNRKKRNELKLVQRGKKFSTTRTKKV